MGMVVRIGSTRRWLVAVAGAIVLSACGSTDGAEPAPPSPSASSKESGDAGGSDYAYDTTFTGDDLLATDLSSLDIPDTASSITWRFPSDFLDDTATSAIDPDNDRSYLSITADLDTDLETAVNALKRRYSNLDDAVIGSSDVRVGDRDGVAFSVERVGFRSDLLVAFAIDETTVVAVNYSSADPQDEPAPQKVKAFNQMVGSVQLKSS